MGGKREGQGGMREGGGGVRGERRVSKWPRELLERAATCSPS